MEISAAEQFNLSKDNLSGVTNGVTFYLRNLGEDTDSEDGYNQYYRMFNSLANMPCNPGAAYSNKYRRQDNQYIYDSFVSNFY